MSVHYKFKSALESDTVTFDGLHISVKDLKNSIMQQKRIGRNNDFDLQVTNAETKEVYDSEDTLIPKNTSLLIARIPSQQTKPKVWEGYGDSSSPASKVDDLGPIGKAMDLASLDASEEDKIKAMMSQSTQDYDPSNYMKIRGANQVGAVPLNYRCYKCHQGGHWIKDCTLNQGAEAVEIKKSTGIPRSFMVTVDGPQVQGAMITPNGLFAVPALDHQAYTEKSHPVPPPEENKTDIPEDLLCSLCSDLLADAVMIPCCGDSFCDECIRSRLLESEENECPACHEKEISPGTLIPNRYLRNSVTNFRSTTGYVKRPAYKHLPSPVYHTTPAQTITKVEYTPSIKETKEEFEELTYKAVDESNSNNVASEIPTVSPENKIDDTKENNIEEPNLSPTNFEVSPTEEPTGGTVQTIITGGGGISNKRTLKINLNERSPRRRYHKSSPPYPTRNERGGTPTIDEPGIPPNSVDPIQVYPQTSAPVYQNAQHPNMGMMGLPPPPNLQGPPANFGVPVYPPPNPPIMQPNFRLPPPAGAPYPHGGYPPRPMYEMGRPPAYPPLYPSGSRSSKGRDYHRDYPIRRGRSPPRLIIDDPLEAFNRMLREKDERERRAKQRKSARSYSRSPARSVTPSPPRKSRVSRSPRRRSRSRSYSISRSRSRSFSPGPRISPGGRNFSPKRPYRKLHGRYGSPPIRSPPRYRYTDDRDHRPERIRDVHGFNRDEREREREREFREREARDRDYKYYDAYDRNRGAVRPQWNGPRNPPEQYYPPPPEMAIQQPYIPPNRYPHEVYPPHIPQPQLQPPPQIQLAPPIRNYQEDVVPPGTEQPPVPGLENVLSIEERYQYLPPVMEPDVIRPDEVISPMFDQQRYDAMGGNTPERKYYSPPPRKPELEYQASPEKHHRRRKHEDAFDRKKDVSDDERSSRRNKEKKRKKDKREKKEEERKKRRERKEKREQEKQSKKMEEKSERRHKRETKRQEDNNEAEEIRKRDDEVKTHKHRDRGELEDASRDLQDKVTTNDHVMEHEEVIQNTEETHEFMEASAISEEAHSPEKPPPLSDLYGDLLTEEIDNNVIEHYGKIKNPETDIKLAKAVSDQTESAEDRDEGEISDDEDEKDILDLHTNEAELKIEVKNEVLAPVPERSKWEVDEEASVISSSGHRADSKLERPDKFGKVTNEVLKRAENAIFAKAINAIRPIEIKKISLDRAKLYSGERDKDKSGDELREEAKNIHITITGGTKYENEVSPAEPEKSPPKVRLSVKERLGCKVDDLDRIVKIDKPYDRNRSDSLSPLSRRSDLMSRNLEQGERRLDSESRNRNHGRGNKIRERNRDVRHPFRNDSKDNRHVARNDKNNDRSSDRHNDRKNNDRNSDRNKDRNNDRHNDRNKDRSNDRNRRDRQDANRKKDDKNKSSKVDIDKKSHDKRKVSRSKSNSADKDKHKRKDKKDKKKEKVKHHKKEGTVVETNKGTNKPTKNNTEDKSLKSATNKRKPTLDEANFEPDYDLESESEKEDFKKTEKEDVKKSEKEDLKKSEKVDIKKSEKEDIKKNEKEDVKKTENEDLKKSKLVEEKQQPAADSTKKQLKTDHKDSSSSYSSDSSSEDDRKRRRHRKHKRRKNRRDSSSSSSSESESDTSDEDRDKRRKRHKKKLKKKKKSKHK